MARFSFILALLTVSTILPSGFAFPSFPRRDSGTDPSGSISNCGPPPSTSLSFPLPDNTDAPKPGDSSSLPPPNPSNFPGCSGFPPSGSFSQPSGYPSNSDGGPPPSTSLSYPLPDGTDAPGSGDKSSLPPPNPSRSPGCSDLLPSGSFSQPPPVVTSSGELKPGDPADLSLSSPPVPSGSFSQPPPNPSGGPEPSPVSGRPRPSRSRPPCSSRSPPASTSFSQPPPVSTSDGLDSSALPVNMVVVSSSTIPPPTTTPSASTPASNSSTSSDIQAFLQGHNDFRAKHGASPLVWDDVLASKAQEWTNRCVWEHSKGTLGNYGENMAAGYDIPGGIKAWTDEESRYDPSNPEAEEALHFTQVVWKSTTSLGCALQICDNLINSGINGPTNFMVCEYSPPGNMQGEFSKNVQA